MDVRRQIDQVYAKIIFTLLNIIAIVVMFILRVMIGSVKITTFNADKVLDLRSSFASSKVFFSCSFLTNDLTTL